LNYEYKDERLSGFAGKKIENDNFFDCKNNGEDKQWVIMSIRAKMTIAG